MMSSNRRDYSSALEWLSALRQDEAWLRMQQKLQKATSGDFDTFRKDAIKWIGQGATSAYCKIFDYEVESVVTRVWEDAELTLPKLKIQTIGMLTIEWLQKHKKAQPTPGTPNSLTGILASKKAMLYWNRLQQAGFVDERCRLKPKTTRKQAMYIAEVFAERLGIESKWKSFERLWDIHNLAQEKWHMQDAGSLPSRSMEIDKIFKD